MIELSGFAALYIFMLAAFTGYEVIAKVPAILHTPLMSGSNFVHGIVVVGAMVALGNAESTAGQVIGFIGVILGAGNAVGGYVGGGIGAIKVELETPGPSADEIAFGYQAMVGLTYAINSASLFAEYRYQAAQDVTFTGTDLGYESHTIGGGVRFGF